MIIYGGPTTGKSYLQDKLKKEGIPTYDTDQMLAELGHDPTATTQPSKEILSQIIDNLKEIDTGSVIFTNLHSIFYDDFKPDRAFWRNSNNILAIMEGNGQVTDEEREAILKWNKPTIGETPIKVLPPEVYMSDYAYDDILKWHTELKTQDTETGIEAQKVSQMSKALEL